MFRISIKAILLTVMGLIFAYLTGGRVPYSISYCFIVALILGAVSVIIQKRSLKINVVLKKDVYSAGDNGILYTIIHSKSFIPSPYYVIENQALKGLLKNYYGNVIYLDFQNTYNTMNEINFNLRGVYDFGKVVVTFSDLFCIYKMKKSICDEKNIRVYPKVYKIYDKSFHGRNIIQNSIQNLSIAEDSNDIRDLRRYREGDSPKRINWKVSAKHNELYVKNFNAVNSKDANFFLNMQKSELLHEESDLKEEEMIDFCVSIINYFQTKNIKTKIFINNEEGKQFELTNKQDFEILMDYFLFHKSEGENIFSSFIDSYINCVQDESWIGIITLVVDEELIAKISTLISIGHSITVFYTFMNANDYSLENSKVEFIKSKELLYL